MTCCFFGWSQFLHAFLCYFCSNDVCRGIGHTFSLYHLEQREKLFLLPMETGHTHILVPLHTWNTIKKHIAVLEQTGSEILELSQKRCDVHEMSGVVKSLMDSIDTDMSAFCSYDSDASLFEEAIEEPNDVPQSVPKEDGVSMPEVLKMKPVPPASPPPRKLLVKAHGPFPTKVLPRKVHPWRCTPYSKDSRRYSSSSTASTWNTSEHWY